MRIKRGHRPVFHYRLGELIFFSYFKECFDAGIFLFFQCLFLKYLIADWSDSVSEYSCVISIKFIKFLEICYYFSVHKIDSRLSTGKISMCIHKRQFVSYLNTYNATNMWKPTNRKPWIIFFTVRIPKKEKHDINSLLVSSLFNKRLPFSIIAITHL